MSEKKVMCPICGRSGNTILNKPGWYVCINRKCTGLDFLDKSVSPPDVGRLLTEQIKGWLKLINEFPPEYIAEQIAALTLRLKNEDFGRRINEAVKMWNASVPTYEARVDTFYKIVRVLREALK